MSTAEHWKVIPRTRPDEWNHDYTYLRADPEKQLDRERAASQILGRAHGWLDAANTLMVEATAEWARGNDEGAYRLCELAHDFMERARYERRRYEAYCAAGDAAMSAVSPPVPLRRPHPGS